MKIRNLQLILFFAALLALSTGCDPEVVTHPTIIITSPEANESFTRGDTLKVTADITHDNDLTEAIVTLFHLNDLKTTRLVSLSGKSGKIDESFVLNFNSSDQIIVLIEVEDVTGLKSEANVICDYSTVGGNLDLRLKLQYEGQPIVMFEEYEYPDGRKMEFTRFSMYISDLFLGEEKISKIEFHNLTSSHSTASGAFNGYSWQIPEVPVGNYEELSFQTGVIEELNAFFPSDFLSNHPLAKPAEHWFSWGSYIFVKIEGNIDTNNDGEKNQSIALHLGADEALREVVLNKSIKIEKDISTTVNINIDLYDCLGGSENTYDIDMTPKIHHQSQMEEVLELAENFKNSITIN